MTDARATSGRVLDPACSVSLVASAGSGKTWQLVSRILRLLLAGAEPGGILALTFTRKAAVEMHLRLQGVGPGQPRRVVVPFELLLRDPSLEPETIAGKAFQAEVVEAAPGRWVVADIAFGERRVLRSE